METWRDHIEGHPKELAKLTMGAQGLGSATCVCVVKVLTGKICHFVEFNTIFIESFLYVCA